MRSARNALLTCSTLAFSLGAFAQGAQEVAVADGVESPPLPAAASSAECVINNIQGGLASGSVSLFDTPGNAIHTLFDPSGSGMQGDPGCFISTPYPYTVNSVDLNIADASVFPAIGTGLGTLEFEVKILEAEITDECAEPGSEIFSSGTLTEEMDDSGFHPVNIPVGEDVSGPFFVAIEVVSWDGPVDQGPSLALWDAVANEACRQYVATDGGETVEDFQEVFGTSGWTNVIVNGEVPDQSGDVDFAVNSVTTTESPIFATNPTIIEAEVENVGDIDVADVPLSLTEDGNEVATTTISLLAGEMATATFNYTPAMTGDFELVAEVSATDDVDAGNNSASTNITVVEGDVDLAVNSVSTDAVDLIVGVSNTINAEVENVGDLDVVDAPLALLEDGNEVATTTISLEAGATGTASFAYTPAAEGEYTLTADANAADDVDESNDTSTLDVTVIDLPYCFRDDDMESYTAGEYVGPQGEFWSTWSGEGSGTAEDAFVIDSMSASGSNSIVFDNSSTDVLYLLGGQTAGVFETSFQLYVPADSGAYFNLQKTETAGEFFAYEIVFNGDGTGTLNYAGTSADFVYPVDEWFEFRTLINLNVGTANLFVAGNYVANWDYTIESDGTEETPNSIGAFDFFPAGAEPGLYYVDDIRHCAQFNDDPCSALEIASGATLTSDNSDATVFDDTLVPSCWTDGEDGGVVHGDLWYEFEAPNDGTYQITTDLEVLTNDDTQLGIYTSSDGTCEGDLTEAACGEDVDVDNGNYLSTASIELSEGDVVFIQVDGWDGTAGTFQIQVSNITPPPNDICADAIDLSDLAGGPLDEAQVSDAYTSINATTSEDDPSADCFFLDDPVQAPIWYSFEGDGYTYYIETTNCDGVVSYLEDTQMLIGTGGCGDSFTEVACAEDIDSGGNVEEAGVELETEEGTTYYILVDGNGGTGPTMGDYCLSFTNMNIGIQEIERVGLNVFPNPATSIVNLSAEKNIEEIRVMNTLGQTVLTEQSLNTTRTQLDISGLAEGMYMLDIKVAGEIYTTRISKQ